MGRAHWYASHFVHSRPGFDSSQELKVLSSRISNLDPSGRIKAVHLPSADNPR